MVVLRMLYVHIPYSFIIVNDVNFWMNSNFVIINNNSDHCSYRANIMIKIEINAKIE